MKALGVVDYCAKLKEEGERSVTMAFPSMMIMKCLMKSSVTVTGISADQYNYMDTEEQAGR